MARQFLAIALLVVLGVAVHETLADEPERILGGTNANPGEFPYQVSIRQSNGGHFCGGTLVTTGHVVTAAHCVHDQKPEDIVVATGSVDRDGGEIHKVRLIRVYPDFVLDKATSLKNDIAVLTLESGIEVNDNQAPIPFAAEEPPHGTALNVTGWGFTGVKGPSAEVLQKATVFIVSDELCRLDIPQSQPLYDTQICASNVQGIGSCSGDSGGPLVYENQLVGVVSWGFPCATGLPDVYTRASKYYDFVTESILLSYEQ